jgi:peptide/nickel transport system permease protein
MINYLIRRIALGLLTLLLITFVVYGLIRHMPGTPLTTDQAVMDPAAMLTPQEVERLNRLYGLDKPWYEAYFVWLKNVVRFRITNRWRSSSSSECRRHCFSLSRRWC